MDKVRNWCRDNGGLRETHRHFVDRPKRSERSPAKRPHTALADAKEETCGVKRNRLA